MMKKILILLMFMFSQVLCSNTIRAFSAFRNILVIDKKMPSIYLDNKMNIEDNMFLNAYSLEHIFPQSLIEKKHCNDMHNVIKTLNRMNYMRSNYRFADNLISSDNWIKLEYDNYVNHKKKSFIPNDASRGFISRAILYMSKEYGYNIEKIISKDILLDWFFKYPPTLNEKYHNEMVKRIQNTNNIFISKYNSRKIKKYVENI